jgi:hypothetical protein
LGRCPVEFLNRLGEVSGEIDGERRRAVRRQEIDEAADAVVLGGRRGPAEGARADPGTERVHGFGGGPRLGPVEIVAYRFEERDSASVPRIWQAVKHQNHSKSGTRLWA